MAMLSTDADNVTALLSNDDPDIEDAPFEVIGTPFVMAPMWVALNASTTALALYVALASFVNIKRGDRTVWPTEKTLGRRIHLSDRRMRPYLKELQALGAVDVRVHRYGPNRMKKRNVYFLRFDPPPGFEGYLSGDEFDKVESEGTPASGPVRTPASGPDRPADSRPPVRTPASGPVRTPASPELDEQQNYKKNPPPTPRADRAASVVPQPREGGEDLRDEETNLDIEALVEEVRVLRPHWSRTGIRKALEHPDVLDRPHDLIRPAMLIVAKDEFSKVAGRLRQDGPWWDQAAIEVRKASRPAPPPKCDSPECGPDRMISSEDFVTPCPRCNPRVTVAAPEGSAK